MRNLALKLAVFSGFFALSEAPVPEVSAQSPNRAIVVSVTDKTPIRVRIADGNTAPCDSSNNTVLFDGNVSSDAPVTRDYHDCVCVEQAYTNFPTLLRSRSWQRCYGRVNCAGTIRPSGRWFDGIRCAKTTDEGIRLSLGAVEPKEN